MGVFVGFSCIFLLGILIFKGLTARRLYKSFDVKGLIKILYSVQLLFVCFICIILMRHQLLSRGDRCSYN
jgi:hypothetical protein